MTIHKGPPPGLLTIEQVCERLGMSRQNFYNTGLADVLDSWQVSANTPRLYLKEDAGKLSYWLFVREGQIALGAIPPSTPIKPDFDLEAWFDDDLWGGECDKGHQAVVDPDDGRVWCRECREFNLKPTPAGQAGERDE